MSKRKSEDEPPGDQGEGEEGDLVASGWWGYVRYARRLSGAMEAKEWLENAALSIQSRFDHLFRRMAETGVISNVEQFRKLDGEIWEFKRLGDRIPCFRIDVTWFLTHHFAKGANTNKEISRADRIRMEHLEQ